MSERTRPPFRADHVGSLLRPPELLSREQQAAKLALIVDTAKEVWG
jgi:5-methyltetrahydropteroyltriglutamate--homocysteine methyltransferase